MILLFEDASISYSDDLIQAVQLQVSYVVIFHSESNLRELEELEDRLQHGNSKLFVPLWKKPLLLVNYLFLKPIEPVNLSKASFADTSLLKSFQIQLSSRKICFQTTSSNFQKSFATRVS